MNPEAAVLVDDLERQLALLRRIRDRLRSTERVHPGTSTFWSGQARAAYELAVACLSDALDRVDSALQGAVTATSRALGTLRA